MNIFKRSQREIKLRNVRNLTPEQYKQEIKSATPAERKQIDKLIERKKTFNAENKAYNVLSRPRGSSEVIAGGLFGFQRLVSRGLSSPNAKRGYGGRGRPRGTYNSRYARYGGVYGYRKVLAQQLREQRLNAMRRSVVNPQQQTILDQIEARERARRSNPENRVIPDTDGRTPTRTFQQEIDDATNLVP